MKEAVQVIYVDLDQTLIRIDLFQERLLLGGLRTIPLLFRVLFWYGRGGRVLVKSELADRYPIDPRQLPYNQTLLQFLEAEKKRGTILILATASPRKWADSVAKHLGIFDHVLATDPGLENLKGARKLKAILRHAEGRPFGYAGDASCDTVILEAASLPIVVNGPKSLAGKKADEALLITEKKSSSDKWWMSLRLHQWSKNILIFAPLLASHHFDATWKSGVIAFLAFGCTASALYLLNDLYDVDLDRLHFEKRRRAVATGTLTPSAAVILMMVLGVCALILSWELPARFGEVLLCYAAINLLYSKYIKSIPSLDVVTLAFLYCIRILAGGGACGIPISIWLAALTFFTALSLAHLKRYLEMAQRTRRALSPGSRPAYRAADAEILALIGVAAGMISVLVTVLYIASPLDSLGYHRPHLLFVICILQFYWLERMWLLAFRGEMSSDPVGFIIRDKISYGVAVLALIIMWAAVVL